MSVERGNTERGSAVVRRRSAPLDEGNRADIVDCEPGLPEPRYKRPFDLVCGIILLALSAPIFAVVGVLVKLTSRGPIAFRQERLGKNGRPFILYKFRTMYHGASHSPHEEYFKQYLKGSPAAVEAGAVYKLRRDPRITPVGGILRRLAIDELPQLLNVVKGDMSLVGPRPPLAYEVACYSHRHMLRLQVKPGATGLWQIRGRDIVDFETMIDMDLTYIANRSLWSDIGILLATVPTLARNLNR